MAAGQNGQPGRPRLSGRIPSLPRHPRARRLLLSSPGTKVALQGSLAQIGAAVDKLKQRGIPHYLVIDSGCPDFFNGSSVLTAIGFGPSIQAVARKITKGLKLL